MYFLGLVTQRVWQPSDYFPNLVTCFFQRAWIAKLRYNIVIVYDPQLKINFCITVMIERTVVVMKLVFVFFVYFANMKQRWKLCQEISFSLFSDMGSLQ